MEALRLRPRPGRPTFYQVTPGANPEPELDSQARISEEIEAIGRTYGEGTESQPRLDYPPYRSSRLRHPTKATEPADPEGVELWSPVFGDLDVDAGEADLTVQHDSEPIGERMVVTGRVVDGDGRAVRRQLVEVWQANAAG